MKLCVVTPAHWDEIMGGAQYQVKLLIEHLAASGGYEIYYIARKAKTESSTARCTVIKLKGVPRLRRFAHVVTAPSLWGVLNEIRPDVIYQRVACAYTGVCAHYARRAGARMIWHIASEMDVRPLDIPVSFRTWHLHAERKLTEYGIRNADQVVAQTSDQERLLRRNFDRSVDAVIPNFHPLPKEPLRKDGRLKIVWIANMKHVKQPELFARLARDLARWNDVDFLLIGRESDDEDVRARMRHEFTDTPNLAYLGCQPQEVVNQWLARSHLLVNTSRIEGFSNTFIQAWMREVPVLTLNVNPDGMLDDQEMGLCANGSYEQLLIMTERLIRDRSLLMRMGRRCRERSIKIHSLSNVDALGQLIAGVDRLSMGHEASAFDRAYPGD